MDEEVAVGRRGGECCHFVRRLGRRSERERFFFRSRAVVKLTRAPLRAVNHVE